MPFIGMSIGRVHGIAGAVAARGFSLDAPVASWVSAGNVAQAIFEVVVGDVTAGMKIFGEISTSSDFASILETTSASISGADLIDLQIDDFAFSPLSAGTYYARFWTATSGDVQNSDKSNTVTQTIDVDAPTITSANSGNNAENSVLAHALTANESVTWSIVGGADSARFELSGSTLRWLSNGTKDYESPNDADTNNTYVVTVRATDTATNTTDQTITITVTDVGDGPSAEVTQYLDRATGMDATHVNAFTALIDGLVADGVWSLLDCLYILATDTEAHAKLNVKSPSFTITETGTVSFTANVGYSCGSADTTNFLDSGFNPSTAGGSWVQNSGHQSVWCNTNALSGTGTMAAADGSFDSFMTVRNGSDQFVGRINNVRTGSNGVIVGSNTNSIGHWLVSRTGATTLTAYKNGSSIGANSDASAAPVNLSFGVGGRNFEGTFSGGGQQISAATFGGGLDAAGTLALYNRLSAYRTAVGL